jgi:NAD(P)-dependent dehydrogenase (short-subunit alcohol dehydrogenase family)
MTADRSVVVTGASTGIGWATVKVLVARGFEVFGSVRKQSDADRLANEFGRAFTPLLMDVTDHAALARAAELVGARLGQRRLAGLVNNAGIAVPGPLLHLPLAEYRRQLEVNLIAPLGVIQAFAPLLGTDRGREGDAGSDSEHQLRRGQSRSPLPRGIRSIQAWLGRDVRIPAAGAHAIRDRRDRHWTRSSRNADLG